MNTFGFKDLDSVRLKATYNMNIGDRMIEANETILMFDKLQLANLREIQEVVNATGGFDNRNLISWQTTKEINFSFVQGVVSKEQLSLMLNAKLVNIEPTQPVAISYRENLESDENGVVTCKYIPSQNIYVYDKKTGEKLSFNKNGQRLTINRVFLEVVVDYQFLYVDGVDVINIGQKLLTGFIALEGITRIKDDVTGQVVTGIIKIPHLRLMSDLSISLGAQATPLLVNFSAIGVPVGARGDSYVMSLEFLHNDIINDL